MTLGFISADADSRSGSLFDYWSVHSAFPVPHTSEDLANTEAGKGTQVNPTKSPRAIADEIVLRWKIDDNGGLFERELENRIEAAIQSERTARERAEAERDTYKHEFKMLQAGAVRLLKRVKAMEKVAEMCREVREQGWDLDTRVFDALAALDEIEEKNG